MENKRKHTKNKRIYLLGATCIGLLILLIVSITNRNVAPNEVAFNAQASTAGGNAVTVYNLKSYTSPQEDYYQKYTDKLENKDVQIHYKRSKVTYVDGYSTYAYSKVKTTRKKSSKTYTKTDNYTFKTGTGETMKKWYKPHNGPVNDERRTLQNFTFGKGSDAYLSYATGDLRNDGYIYHYDSKGKLLDKSPKIRFGHGQSISYLNGSMYIGADIPDVTNQRIYQYDVKTWRVKKQWKVPQGIVLGTMTMRDENTAVVARKYDVDRGYELVTLKLDDDSSEAYVEKIQRFEGVVGTTKQRELQAITYYKGYYYLATNGYYVKINEKTGKRTNVRMNIARENEGIGFSKTGRLVWAVALKNQLFIEK